MGRIKTQLTKRTTFQLWKQHAAEVKPNFEDNKKLVSSLLDIFSKKHRNIIAGYLTRMKRAEE